MRTCIVPFCDFKNKDQASRSMFLMPRERTLFAQWVAALPKIHTFRATDRVCYLHFRPEDILDTFDHCINGQVYKIKRDRPRLKPNAVPCLGIATKGELPSHRVKSRVSSHFKNIEISDNTNTFDLNLEKHQQNNETEILKYDKQSEEKEEGNFTIIAESEDDMPEFVCHERTRTEEFESQIADLIVENDNDSDDNCNQDFSALTNLFNFFYENAYEVLTPNTLWGIHRCPNRSFICYSYMDALKMRVTKLVYIKPDGSMQWFFDENLIKTWQLLHDIKDLDSLSLHLHKVDAGQLCFGKSTNAGCGIVVEPNDDNLRITDNNEQVFLCTFCLQNMES